MDILCYGASSALVTKNAWGKCSNIAHASFKALNHKVVVIGEHVDADLQPFPGEEQYGVNLQANYIEALLSRRFVHELDYRLDWGLVGAFVLLFAIFDLYAEDLVTHYRPHWAKDKELVVALTGLGLLALWSGLSYALLICFGLFTPITLLSIFPILVYLLLRLGWFVVNRVHKPLSFTKETA